MYSLSQSYFVNERKIDEEYKISQAMGQRSGVTFEQFQRAVQLWDMKNLPTNHSVFELDRNYFLQKNIPANQKELPFCFVVPSYNNAGNDRYKKSLNSILMQEYSNYHIVYVDDHSTDGTLDKAAQFLKEMQFPAERATLLRNEKNMKATYSNMRGSKECKSGEIMVSLDGDDELLGRYVLKMINAKYHEGDYWLVYTNFIQSTLKFGNSKPVPKDFYNGPRRRLHIIGPVRTWYVDLYWKIKEEDHKTFAGEYFPALSDDVEQFPLLEMAGPKHVFYMTEICLLYNRYSNNDDTHLYGIMLQ